MDTNHQDQSSVSNETHVHRFPSDWRADEETLTRLTHAIAVITNQHPERVDLGIPDLVDPDALDRLFTPEADGEDAQLTLLTSCFEIQIRADGSLQIIE